MRMSDEPSITTIHFYPEPTHSCEAILSVDRIIMLTKSRTRPSILMQSMTDDKMSEPVLEFKCVEARDLAFDELCDVMKFINIDSDLDLRELQRALEINDESDNEIGATLGDIK